jgi:uncharacterized protein (TIGR00725 family)
MRVIGVVGGGHCTPHQADLAREVGRRLAQHGVVLVCGGGGGVMESACQGALEAGGFTLGILSGSDPAEANRHVRLAIPTGLGEARNAVIVLTAEALIAIGGEGGTLSEVGLALRQGKRVIALESWVVRQPDGQTPQGVVVAQDPEQAVQLALEAHAGCGAT